MTQIPEEIIKEFALKLLSQTNEDGGIKYTEEEVAQLIAEIENVLNQKNLNILKN